MFTNGLGDWSSIPGQVIPKTQNQGMELSPPLHLGVVAIEKGAFGSPSTMIINFTYFMLPYIKWLRVLLFIPPTNSSNILYKEYVKKWISLNGKFNNFYILFLGNTNNVLDDKCKETRENTRAICVCEKMEVNLMVCKWTNR